MKRLHPLLTSLFLLLATLSLGACRANLGNLFDLY